LRDYAAKAGYGDKFGVGKAVLEPGDLAVDVAGIRHMPDQVDPMLLQMLEALRGGAAIIGRDDLRVRRQIEGRLLGSGGQFCDQVDLLREAGQSVGDAIEFSAGCALALV
jgi:hypothetical protein